MLKFVLLEYIRYTLAVNKKRHTSWKFKYLHPSVILIYDSVETELKKNYKWIYFFFCIRKEKQMMKNYPKILCCHVYILNHGTVVNFQLHFSCSKTIIIKSLFLYPLLVGHKQSLAAISFFWCFVYLTLENSYCLLLFCLEGCQLCHHVQ